ncbi:MAG: MurR/RpiR family transcriptional regulator [Leptothrix sp. (in: b-proteobacteria)]
MTHPQHSPLRTAGTTARSADSEPRLLHALQRDLPTLSPKLKCVAQFCIQHAATLHHYRVQDVAEACGTIPASVVRVAQKFGLKGFQELKIALLDRIGSESITLPDPQEQLPEPECIAARQDIDDSLLGLSSLKGLVSQPEFLHAVHSLRSAMHIRFEWNSEADRMIATHLQTCMRAAGSHQIESTLLDTAGDAAQKGEWLVQAAVWNEAPAGPRTVRMTGFGPRVIRLAQGRMNRFATCTRKGVVIRVGTDTRRMLNALALCEALASAVKSSPCAHA